MGLLHASILNTMPNVEVVALCDKSFVIRKLVKKLFRTAQVIDDAKKLSDLDINSVYVTTSIPSHFSVVKQLLSDNVKENIFVEKTLTSNFDESRHLCDLVRTSETVNMVGYMKRFAVTFAKAKNILANGALGELSFFDAYAYSSDFSEVQVNSKKSTSRGGSLSDLGSHIIDLALWFFGDFDVQSASLESMSNDSCEDSADFRVAKCGLNGRFHISWCMNNYRMPSFGLIIKGTNGVLKVDDYKVALELNDRKPNIWFKHDLNDYVGFLLGESEYYREDAVFVNSIDTGISIEPNFKSASKVDWIIDQVKKGG
jgi:predicted dehydrogenase